MSAVPVGHREQERQQRPGEGAEPAEQVISAGEEEATVAPTPVVVRRRAGVAALIGYAASAVAIAYLWRASQTMTVLDWVVCGVMAVIAGVYLTSLVDARTPLLVADDLGVRIRLGNEWRGLPWEAIGQVVVHPRRGPFRDGRLVFAPRNLTRALEGLDAKTRRHIALNQKMYGAPLAVPLGSTTRVTASGRTLSPGSTGREEDIAEDLEALVLGRSEVVLLDPETLEVVGDRRVAGDGEGEAEPSEATPDDEPQAVDEPPARKWLRGRTRARAQEDAEPPRDPASPAGHGPTEAPEETVDPSDQPSNDSAARPQQVVFPAAGAEVAWRHAEATAAPAEATTGDTGDGPATGAPRRSMLGGIGAILSRAAKGRAHDVDTGAHVGTDVETDRSDAATTAREAGHGSGKPEADEAGSGGVTQGEIRGAAQDQTEGAAGGNGRKPAVPEQAKPPFAAASLREARPGLRAEATLEGTDTDGNTALDTSETGDRTTLPEGRELRRPGSVDLVFERVEAEDRIRPISTLGDPVEPLVIDDFVTEPAYDPVIGPELAAARTRLGLSVDDLAERTRIRPHVIESIEVDDFAPCGGDFYARGHLRTLARILGLNAEPLLEKFEERYATAPINARRVFEAELATGMTGSMRSTMGGPSWGLLVGVVLCLVLVWGVLRLFATEPAEVRPPVINGSATVVVPDADRSSDDG